jgi:hypothetical protein
VCGCLGKIKSALGTGIEEIEGGECRNAANPCGFPQSKLRIASNKTNDAAICKPSLADGRGKKTEHDILLTSVIANNGNDSIPL